MIIKKYSELVTLQTLAERYEYLKLDGAVGQETFGFSRHLNQALYCSKDWLLFRDEIIVRDMGCDLALEGYELRGTSILIHHINPITEYDIVNRSKKIFDPENVVCTKLSTHNAIHYGDYSLIDIAPIERSINDTCPWR